MGEDLLEAALAGAGAVAEGLGLGEEPALGLGEGGGRGVAGEARRWSRGQVRLLGARLTIAGLGARAGLVAGVAEGAPHLWITVWADQPRGVPQIFRVVADVPPRVDLAATPEVVRAVYRPLASEVAVVGEADEVAALALPIEARVVLSPAALAVQVGPAGRGAVGEVIAAIGRRWVGLVRSVGGRGDVAGAGGAGGRPGRCGGEGGAWVGESPERVRRHLGALCEPVVSPFFAALAGRAGAAALRGWIVEGELEV